MVDEHVDMSVGIVGAFKVESEKVCYRFLEVGFELLGEWLLELLFDLGRFGEVNEVVDEHA